MSFILDALRKSETERQRQAMPGLVDAGYRPPAARRAIWIPVLIVVLAANLALMAVFWWRSQPDTAPPPAAAPAAAPAPVAGNRPTRPSAGPGNTLSAVAGIPPAAGDMPANQGDVAASGGEAYTEIFEPPLETGAVSTAVTAVDAAGAEPAPGSRIRAAELPTARELAANGGLALPALHLDIHVFSATPAERFAFINMKKYVEGAALAEGPQIEEITADGVVLSHNGQRFLLTRD